MDYKSLTSLMLRLAGVFIVVSAITSAPQTFVTLLYSSGGAQLVDTWALAAAGFAVFAIPFLVGLLLIYFPARIANRMLSGAGAETADALVLQQVAFSTLGLYFVTVAAYETFYWWAKLRIYFAVFEEMNFSGLPRRLSETDFAGMMSTGAQFIAGAVLLLGGRGIANLFHRLRSPPALPNLEPSSMPDGPAGPAQR